jgi:hypothetical protein
MMSIKNKGGRPLKFKSPEELQQKIDEFFDKTPLLEQTVTGLALHLDTFRDVLCDYQEKDEFSNTIKRAKLRIEHAYEKRGMEKGGAFDIFRLKNMGWVDKHETDLTSKGEKISNETKVIFEDGTKKN